MCPRRSRPKLPSSSPTVQGAFASGYKPTLYDLPQPNKFQSGVRVGYNSINGEFSHTPMETYTWSYSVWTHDSCMFVHHLWYCSLPHYCIVDADFPTDLEQSFNAGALNTMSRTSTTWSAAASPPNDHTANNSYSDTPHVPDSDIQERKETVCSEQQDFYSHRPNSTLWDNNCDGKGDSWEWRDRLPVLFYPQKYPNMKRTTHRNL